MSLKEQIAIRNQAKDTLKKIIEQSSAAEIGAAEIKRNDASQTAQRIWARQTDKSQITAENYKSAKVY